VLNFETPKTKPFINDIIKLEPEKPVKVIKQPMLFKEEKLEGDNIQMDEFNYNPDEDEEFQSYLNNINKKAKKVKPIVINTNLNSQELVSTINIISQNPDKFEHTNKVNCVNLAFETVGPNDIKEYTCCST
jgi:hypothetical protein